MAQKPQIVDLRKSFYPGDPQAIQRNLVNTNKEDGEEQTMPIIPFEGYNFLPTAYGYRSYFGINSNLSISALNSNVQEVLSFLSPKNELIFIALCDDGIYYSTTSIGTWAYLISYAVTDERLWTHCVIENNLYCYQRGRESYIKIDDFTFATETTCSITGITENPGAVNSNFMTGVTYRFFIAARTADGMLRSTNTYFDYTTTEFEPSLNVSYIEDPDAVSYVIAWIDPNDASFPVYYISEALPSDPIVVNRVAYSIAAPSITATSFQDNVSFNIPFDTDISYGSSFTIVPNGGGSLPADTYDVYLLTYRLELPPTSNYPLSQPKFIDSITIGNLDTVQFSVTNNSTIDTILFWALFKSSSGVYYLFSVNNIAPTDTNFDELNTSSNINILGAFPIHSIADYEVVVPSFLNMAGQIGIFKAGTRLGFWDSDNSVAWSSNLDLTDFTPSLENLAGNAIFADVQGKIVTIKNHGEGFMIYSTKSIIGISPKLDSNFLWDAKDVFSSVGLVHPLSAVNSYNESEHFAIVTNGIVRLGKLNGLAGKYDTEYLFPEIYDFLRETRKPIFLKLVNQRYLSFELFDARHIEEVGVRTNTLPADNLLASVGNVFSLYTERKGALVFDLHLKKWGKLKQDYQVLTDYLALNIPSYNIFSHTDLGITGGLLKNGLLYNFDTQPSDGYIKYGKVGYYRLGVVHFLETRLDFRRMATGTLTIETSLNGRTTDASLDHTTNFTNINTLTIFPNLRYRWYTIKLEGEWDLQYMEVRANFSGRR